MQGWMNRKMMSKMIVADCLHENWLIALSLKTSPWTYYESIFSKRNGTIKWKKSRDGKLSVMWKY